MSLPMWPVWLIDIIGSAMAIVLTGLAFYHANNIRKRKEGEMLFLYLFLLAGVLFLFALSRSIGHICQHILIFSGRGDIWSSLSPISGGFNSLAFIAVGTLALLYSYALTSSQKVGSITTEKNQIESLLREKNALHEAITDSIFVLDPDMTITDANPAALEAIGKTRGEVINRKCHEISHNRKEPCRGPEDICPAEEIRRTGKPATCMHIHYKGDGTPYYMEITASPLIGPDGKIHKIVEISRDITERKKAEEALRESEMKYSELVQQAPDAIVSFDKMGFIKAINPATEDLILYKEEDVIGKHFSKIGIVTADSIPKALKTFAMVIAGKEPPPVEINLTRKDKKIIMVEVNPRSTKRNGKIVGVQAIMRDITDRKKMEEELKTSEISYRTLSENLPGIVYRVFLKENNRMQFFNDMVEPITGYSIEELGDGEVCSIDPFIHHEDKPGVLEEVRKAINENRPFQVEYRLAHDDGTLLYLQERGRPIRGNDGSPSYIDGVIFDITENKKIEESLKKYAKQLEESNKIKDLFTDIMRHDLLNPMGIITNTAEILMEENPLDEDLRTIFNQCKKGTELIENATLFSHLESIDDFRIEKHDLKEIMDTVASDLSPMLEVAEMELVNNIKESIQLPLNPMIEHVFVNFLTNAIKYAPGGKKVIIDGMDTEENYRISISDFGPGIPDETKSKIFKRFSRNHGKGVKGSGLGLAIVKLLVDLHKGKVWVEDNPAGGAVFVVEVPRNLDN